MKKQQRIKKKSIYFSFGGLNFGIEDDRVQIGRTMHDDDFYQTEFKMSFFSDRNISKFEIHFDGAFLIHRKI